MSKDKHIKKPQTIDDAMEIIHALGQQFGFQSISVAREDFEDMMNTEGWTKEQIDMAVELAIEEVGDQVGYALDNAIESVNKNK